MAEDLRGKVALVTGASRGVGKGVALALGEAGATVYVTGRTVQEGQAALPGTIHSTAEEVDRLGGHGIAVRCDHREDAQVAQVFERLRREQGRLDLLANAAWGGYEHYFDGTPFWEERGFWTVPLSRWDRMFAAGVRAAYVASALAVPLLLAGKSGLVVHLSSFAGLTVGGDVAYQVAKAATDRMAASMAFELREHGVAVVSLYPGLVRTEGVLRAADHFDLTNSESPLFVGRAVVALATDPDVLRRSGQVVVAAELAEQYGFTDIDGRRPRSLRPGVPGGQPERAPEASA